MGGITFAYDLLPHIIGDEFFEEEGRIEVHLLADCWREKGELEKFGVGTYNDVVEIGLWAQFL